MKTVHVSELSFERMTQGNAARYPAVINDGRVERWVPGKGWSREGNPTATEWATLPMVDHTPDPLAQPNVQPFRSQVAGTREPRPGGPMDPWGEW